MRPGFALVVAGGRELAAGGVLFLDQTMAFADHPEPLYVDACCHFNRSGHQILARAIAQALVEKRRTQSDAGP